MLLRRGLLGLLLGALVLALAPGIATAAPGDTTPTTVEIGEPLYVENPNNPPVTAPTKVLGARYERAPRARALARTGAPLEALALAGVALVVTGELCRRRGATAGSVVTPRG